MSVRTLITILLIPSWKSVFWTWFFYGYLSPTENGNTKTVRDQGSEKGQIFLQTVIATLLKFCSAVYDFVCWSILFSPPAPEGVRSEPRLSIRYKANIQDCSSLSQNYSSVQPFHIKISEQFQYSPIPLVCNSLSRFSGRGWWFWVCNSWINTCLGGTY